MHSLNIADHPAGARISVRVKPRASRSAILEVRDGQLHVALAAPPVDGEANAELIKLLASATGLPRSRLSIASGAKSRTKLVQFAAVTPPELHACLQLITGPRRGK